MCVVCAGGNPGIYFMQVRLAINNIRTFTTLLIPLPL